MSQSISFPAPLRRLINELSKLPTIGEKTATRLACFLLASESEYPENLAQAISQARSKIKLCSECFSFSEEEECLICQDKGRDRSVICVVEKPVDVVAVERSGGYVGLYHVLHGLWSPMRGISPNAIKLPQLFDRLKRLYGASADPLSLSGEGDGTCRSHGLTELIVATSATVEGDATALLIAKNVKDYGLRVTRLAQGLPKGGELEYTDQRTLGYAFEGRRDLSRL